VRVVGLERQGVARPLGGVASVVEARERDQLDLIGHDPGQPARIGPQQADGAGQDCVEHRLHIRLRAADDAQDVAGSGLRVQRRRQLAVARLQLREQAHVLDGDHGLVGEGLEKCDLLVGEGSHLHPANGDHAGGHAFSHQRDAQRRAVSQLPGDLVALGKLIRLGLQVGDMDDPALQRRSTGDGSPGERP
jgi:hypothetical protein